MRLIPFVATLAAFQSPDLDAAIRAFEARRYAEAKPAFLAAAKVDPRAPLYLGRLELLEGDAGDAAKWLEQAVRRDPRSADAHRWLARAYARQVRRVGRLRQLSLAGRIREHFETAVRLAPEHVEARRDLLQYYLMAPRIAGGGRDKAQAQARVLATHSPMYGRLAASWIAEAAGDQVAARREVEVAIAVYPDSVPPLIALGALQQRSSEWEAALATYRRLIGRHPQAREARYQLGRTAGASGLALDEGAAALERFLATPPGEEDAALASAWYRLGLIRERQGDPTRARAAYQQALRMDRGMDEARKAMSGLKKD